MSLLQVVNRAVIRNSKIFPANAVLCNQILSSGRSPMSWRQSPISWRTFSTDVGPEQINITELSKRQNFRDVMELVKDKAEEVAIMEFKDFEEMSKTKGLSQSDARTLADSLETSGTLLQVRDQGKPVSLYLHPKEIEEQLMKTIDPEGLRLDSKKKELADLEEQKAEFDAQMAKMMAKANGVAKAKTTVLAFTCVGILGIMARFTWWTYSWDIMEPVTYFVGAGISTACMFYVVWANEEYGTVSLQDQWRGKELVRQIKLTNFDTTEYEKIKARIKYVKLHIPDEHLSDGDSDN